MFFSPFSIASTSLGEEKASLGAFRTFVRICAYLYLSVSSSSWCLGRAAVCNCGTPWTFLLLPSFFSKIDFPIGKLLAIFDLQVSLLIQCCFNLIHPIVSEEKSKIGFKLAAILDF